jgi:hypothetical protein
MAHGTSVSLVLVCGVVETGPELPLGVPAEACALTQPRPIGWHRLLSSASAPGAAGLSGLDLHCNPGVRESA